MYRLMKGSCNTVRQSIVQTMGLSEQFSTLLLQQAELLRFSSPLALRLAANQTVSMGRWGSAEVLATPLGAQAPSNRNLVQIQSTRFLSATRTMLSDVDPDAHSHAHDDTDPSCSTASESDDFQDKLLSTALKFVPREGWSVQALQSAAAELGISPSAAGILERGPVDLVQYFIRTSYEEFFTQLREKQAQWSPEVGINERIFEALKMRLELNVPYIDTWPQALSLAARPEVLPASLQHLGHLVDTIWHAVGDSALDYSWYVKRGVLAGVYSATELYMLTDLSPGFSDTWDSLRRRIDDMMKAEDITAQASLQVLGSLATIGQQFERLWKDTPKPRD